MTSSGPALTAVQRKLVRDSFDVIRDQLRPVALLFYGKLFELDPSARRLFHIDLGVQSRKIMDTLDSIVQSLDHLESMHDRLAEVGKQHASYGVRPEQYDTVTTALLWAFSQALGADFDKPTREAWREALAHVCAVMKDGACAS
jgi:hemoglobin-like flavoprotein